MNSPLVSYRFEIYPDGPLQPPSVHLVAQASVAGLRTLFISAFDPVVLSIPGKEAVSPRHCNEAVSFLLGLTHLSREGPELAGTRIFTFCALSDPKSLVVAAFFTFQDNWTFSKQGLVPNKI